MLNILYAGSPEISCYVLETLLQYQKAANACFEIVAILTNPPSAKGRHKEPIPTPVALCARKHNIPVLSPEHLLEDARKDVAKYSPDMLVCFSYGHIFGQKFLSLFPLGAINLHPSLLPKYRGASPVPCAILNMEEKTGVTVQKMALVQDAGDILRQKEVFIKDNDTQQTLLEKCAQIGIVLLLEVIEETAKNGVLPEGKKQQGEPSYCSLIQKEQGHINWAESSKKIYAALRAYTPSPGVFCICEGKKMKILEALPVACAEDAPCGTVIASNKEDGILVKTKDAALKLLVLQNEGKKPLFWKDFINGARDFQCKLLQ